VSLTNNIWGVTDPIILHEEEMPPEQKHIVTTYEELRKRNREEYEQKRVPGYRWVYLGFTQSLLKY